MDVLDVTARTVEKLIFGSQGVAMTFMLCAGMFLGVYLYQRYVVKEFDKHRQETQMLLNEQKERSRKNLEDQRELQHKEMLELSRTHRNEMEEQGRKHMSDMLSIIERHKLDIEKLENRLFVIDEELKQCLKHRSSLA